MKIEELVQQGWADHADKTADVADRLESPQLEHFRLTSANDWSMRRTAYAMPVFKVGGIVRLDQADLEGWLRRERERTMAGGRLARPLQLALA